MVGHRDPGPGRRVRRFLLDHSTRRSGVAASERSALARSCVLLALRFLALPLHRRLLVVLATASLGEDAALLDLLVEAAEGALERLVLTHSDFSQSRFTSSGRGLAPAIRARCPAARRRPGHSSRLRARNRPTGPRSVRAHHEGGQTLGGIRDKVRRSVAAGSAPPCLGAESVCARAARRVFVCRSSPGRGA